MERNSRRVDHKLCRCSPKSLPNIWHAKVDLMHLAYYMYLEYVILFNTMLNANYEGVLSFRLPFSFFLYFIFFFLLFATIKPCYICIYCCRSCRYNVLYNLGYIKKIGKFGNIFDNFCNKLWSLLPWGIYKA